MQQVALVQSGCQQWIRQPAAIHGSGQFAFSSSLAVYVHASDTYELRKLLPAHDTQHINALCWSPADANLIATSNAEKVIRVYSIETEAAVYSSRFLYTTTERVSILRWATHHEHTLLAAAGSVLAQLPYKQTAEWKPLHSFRAAIICMQQSATQPRLLAVGCADATLHLFDMLLQKVVCTLKLDEATVPCDLQFDPLSPASTPYLLLLCSNGTVALYGVGAAGASLDLVSSLAKQPAARRTAVFVPNAPGNFGVISDKSGILQVWNVSQQQPLHSLRVGSGPAQSLSFFPGSSRALITFQDGTVLVYDVASQQQLWCTQPGHTETIFDCCWAPDAGVSSHRLATCSFDGTVRVWDAATHACIKTLDTKAPGREEPAPVKGVPANALYSVAWSPDGSLLAASSAGGAVFLFDYAKGTVIKTLQLHTKPCLKVAWHPRKPTLLASSSMDGSVVVFRQTDGSRVRTLQHSSGAAGCAWARDGYLLATTSEAGTVYVYDLSMPEEPNCLLHALAGHAQRSFSVAWSPLLPHLLLSGGDDATARVWDTQAGTQLALLTGHKTEVRALCWHPELPWMVLTGSWDSTIHVFDWRSQTALHVCRQHHSDVYALAMHSSHPWLLTSASRDSTLRFWDVRGLAAGILTRSFMEGALPRGQAEACAEHSSPLMCGPASQELSGWMQSHLPKDAAGGASRPGCLPAAACIELFARLSALFMPPGSTQQLWQLAAAVAAHQLPDATRTQPPPVSSGLPAARLSNASSLSAPATGSFSSESRAGSIGSSGCCTGPGCLCHLARVRSGLVSVANQLELSVRGRGVGRACMGAARKEEVLQEAALMHLQAGDAERCCELLAELGLWPKALALAPAVSQAYWRLLMQRATDAMASKAGAASRDLLPYMLAAGQVSPAVELLLRQKQHEQAASIAAVAAYGGYAKFGGEERGSSRPAASSPSPPRSNSSLLSPSGSGALQAAAAAGALHHSASGPVLTQLPKQQQQQQQQHMLSSGGLLAKRNSLPPLRCTPSAPCDSSEPVVSPSALACAAASTAAEGSDDSAPPAVGSLRLSGLAPLGPASRSASCSGLSTVTHAGAAAAAVAQPAVVSPTEPRWLAAQQSTAGRLQPRHSFGHVRLGLPSTAAGSDGAAAAEAAVLRLEGVCQTQMQLYRSQGQPIKAACAALMMHDVRAAVTALHLGHEPELAAMLCVALLPVDERSGAAAGSASAAMRERVFEALAIKCEAAGDWRAAALALGQLSSDAQHQLQLLVVREEKGRAAAAAAGSGSKDAATSSQPSLRQQLQLPAAVHYAGLAKSAAAVVDPVDCVRYLLLAHQHDHAAAKAINSLQATLADLQHHVLQAAAGFAAGSNTAAAQQQQQVPPLLTSAPFVQLMRWHGCLESFDAASLPPPCWHDVFAHLLLTGALRAFTCGYHQVGSFLLARLRHWLEQHQLAFPLSRAVVLLLKAELVWATTASPEAASSLLHAVLACSDAAADVSAAADSALQELAALPHHPRPAQTPVSTDPAACGSSSVVVSNSSLPHRPPPLTVKRSAVSGQLLSCGPWAFADDGCSVMSLDEAVMLSHVMRLGPFGSGLVLQLLV